MDVDGRDLILTPQVVEHFRGHEWSSEDIFNNMSDLCKKEGLEIPKVNSQFFEIASLKISYPFDSFFFCWIFECHWIFEA